MLAAAGSRPGMPIITEVMDVRNVELVCRYADMLQIGTRNMANYRSAARSGKTQTPVMLKRGMAATIEEWLQAAEYIASRRQQEHHALRARHPNLRDLYPQHLRSERRRGLQGARPICR